MTAYLLRNNDLIPNPKFVKLGSRRVKTTPQVFQAQLGAIISFYQNEGGWYAQLKDAAAPVLIASSDRDEAFPIVDSAILARDVSGAELSIYPDSGYGFLFQYPERFAADVLDFLDRHNG